MLPLNSLLLTVGIRFCVFNWATWILTPLDFSLGKIAPQWWGELKSCPYCNGFWIFLIVDSLLTEQEMQVSKIIIRIGWATFASWVNLILYLGYSILRDNPANKLGEK